MAILDPQEKFADGRLCNERLDRWVLVHCRFVFPYIRRPWRRYKIRRRIKRRTREAEAANKIRIGPRKPINPFRRLVPKKHGDREDAGNEIDVSVSFDIDNLETDEDDKFNAPGLTENPFRSERSGDDPFGVAIVADFTPVRASCADIDSAAPASTYRDVYCKDRPGSSPVMPHVTIIYTPNTPPSSISSKQNIRPMTSYTAPTVVGHLEVPPKSYSTAERQKTKLLAGRSSHNEHTSRSKPGTATPKITQHRDAPSRSKDPQIRKRISSSETASRMSSGQRPSGIPRPSRPSHMKGKHRGSINPLTDQSSQSERAPRSRSPDFVPTELNLMNAKGRPPSQLPFSTTHDQFISTGPVNDETVNDLMPPSLNIHKAGYDTRSFQSRIERTQSSSLNDLDSSIQSPPVHCTAASSHPEVSNRRNALIKMRNGTLPDRPPQMPDLLKQLTRKPVPPPSSSGSATRAITQQQSHRPVSPRGDHIEHHARRQVSQIYQPETPYTPRQVDNTNPSHPNSTRVSWRNMPDSSVRNSSIRRETHQEGLQQRITSAIQAGNAAPGPRRQVGSNSPHRIVPPPTAGVPELPLANDVHPENLRGVLQAGLQTQQRRQEARPINDFEQAPLYDHVIGAGLAARARRPRPPDVPHVDIG